MRNAGVIVIVMLIWSLLPRRSGWARFSYAGQTGISVQRIVVERSVFGGSTELLLSGVGKLKMVIPWMTLTMCGRMDPARAMPSALMTGCRKLYEAGPGCW